MLSLLPGASTMKLVGVLLAGVALFGGGFYTAWHWEAATLADYKAAVTATAAKAEADALAKQQALQAQVDQLDAQYEKQKADDNAQISDLSAAVAAGTQRLFIATTANGSHSVPEAAGTASKPHAAAGPRPVSWHAIDPATGKNLVAVAAAGERCIAQLTALQSWARSITK
jgi:hypothetical protein